MNRGNRREMFNFDLRVYRGKRRKRGPQVRYRTFWVRLCACMWRDNFTKIVACEQALLFGWAKRAARLLFTISPKWRACSRATKIDSGRIEGKYSNDSRLSLRKQPAFRDATTSFSQNWRLRKDCKNSILITCHYPDLRSASDWSSREGNLLQPIKSTPRSG